MLDWFLGSGFFLLLGSMRVFLWIDWEEKTQGEYENHHLEDGGECEAV